MNTQSNSAAAIEATNAKISDLAMTEMHGELARVDFLSLVAEAYLEGTLGATEPKKKNGKVGETQHAEYAWGVWNAGRARVRRSDTISPVKSSRVAELAAIFKAVQHRADLVPATIKAVAELTDATKDLKDKSDRFSARTYDAIIKVSRKQFAVGKAAGTFTPMTDDDIKTELLSKPDPASEEKRVEALVSAIEKLAEEFPANADIYTAAAAGMGNVLAMLKSRREDAEKKAKAHEAMADIDDAEFEEMIRARRAARDAARLMIEGQVAA